MAGESMSYPLKYGYSLVGRVARCGGGVDAEKFLGKLVFAFSPHSRWVVADADGVMLVPEVTIVFGGFFLPFFVLSLVLFCLCVFFVVSAVTVYVLDCYVPDCSLLQLLGYMLYSVLIYVLDLLYILNCSTYSLIVLT